MKSNGTPQTFEKILKVLYHNEVKMQLISLQCTEQCHSINNFNQMSK